MSVRERASEPIYIAGGDTGCLLLHGFAGSPKDMEGLGRELGAAGYTVLCPVLAGHCDASTMELAGWKDWRQSALSSLIELSDHASRIFVIGFSLGGLIGYDLSSSEQVHAVVSINAPIKLVARQEIRGQLLKMARTGGFMGSDLAQIADRVPMACLSSLYDYTGRVEALLPKVTAPALIIQAREDEAVNPGDAKLIKDALGSKAKRIAWIDGAGHESVLEDKLPQVIKEIDAFFKENTGKTGAGDETEK